MTAKIPVWIDTDAGVDDAAALIAACRMEELELRGVCAVAGNLERGPAFERTRNLLALAGRPEVPVYPGAERPLLRKLPKNPHAHHFVSGAALNTSPAPRQTLSAWDALNAEAERQNGALEFVAIGPLTDLAVALGKYPRLPSLLRRIVMMGGAAVGGNITPAAEFNVFADPEAAQAVFRSGIKIVMCGLDVTTAAYLTPGELSEFWSGGTPVSRFLRDSVRELPAFRGEVDFPGVCLHDLCPVLYLAYPQLFTGREAGVCVETHGTVTLGKTVTDLWSDCPLPPKNTFVVLDVDRDGFAARVQSLLGDR